MRIAVISFSVMAVSPLPLLIELVSNCPSFRFILRRLSLSPRRILEQCGVDGARGQVDVSYDRTADEHIFCRALLAVSLLPTSVFRTNYRTRSYVPNVAI